jgi:hypothetical protein
MQLPDNSLEEKSEWKRSSKEGHGRTPKQKRQTLRDHFGWFFKKLFWEKVKKKSKKVSKQMMGGVSYLH